MLAETIHSTADCGNQILLLMGVKRAQRAPTARHPLGFGRALYFWSFMVALLLFTGGGCYSIYEGIHKFRHPDPVENVSWALVILGGSILLEGWALFGNVREMGRRRGRVPFGRYLRDTKDSDLIVVFGENLAAVLGLVLAFGAVVAAWVTGDGRWDAAGSLAIGLVLVGVAVFLAIEVKSLLIGEAADEGIEAAAKTEALADARLRGLGHLITMQQGPGQVLLAARVRVAPGLGGDELLGALRAFEDRLRVRCPEVRWCFTEPMAADAPEGPDPMPAHDG
jgi:cation diffusion facilitator family transporter